MRSVRRVWRPGMCAGLPHGRSHTRATNDILRVNRGDSTQASKLIDYSRAYPCSGTENHAATNNTTNLENSRHCIEVAFAAECADHLWLGLCFLPCRNRHTGVSRTI